LRALQCATCREKKQQQNEIILKKFLFISKALKAHKNRNSTKNLAVLAQIIPNN